MALQVWLPLNGNLNNQGINKLNPVQSTAPTYVNGKIGKAMSTGAFYLPATDVAKFYNNEAMSFCFWIYPTTSSSTTVPIIGQSNTAAGNCRMFTIYQYPNGVDLHLSWQTEIGGNAFLASILSNAFTVNVWNHCAVTYNGSTVTVYINGTVKQTYTNITSTRTNFNYNVPIPNASSRYLNDIRIYDHCLSEREVKEISKGLVVHYPLNNQYETSLRNKFSGTVADGAIGPGSFTRAKLENERGYNYKLTRTGTGSNSWPSLGTSTYTFTAGKRYYYSCKVRCNKWSSGNFVLRASRSSNDWVTNTVEVCSPSKADGKWHEYSCSQIVNETYDRSGSTVTCSPVLEFYASNQNADGTVYDMDFDLKDVQVVESDNYIPFIKNEYAANVVKDVSGYGYNGTNNSVLYSNESIKYKGSAKLQGTTSSYITVPAITLDLNNVTFSIWGKLTALNNWCRFFDFGQAASGGGYSFLIAASNANQKIAFHTSGAGGSNSQTTEIQTTATNTWYHVVVTMNGATAKVYINGTLVKSLTLAAALGIAPLNINYLGKSNWSADGAYAGCLSDFRIYATTLSDADVFELYNTSANITNNGTLMAYEFIEE